MEVLSQVRALRERRASLRSPVGFVPTMGALHAGHASLVERALAECESVVVSIFVNPLQFGPKEDLARYPHSAERDKALLEHMGVDVVFKPQREELLPQEPDVIVEPGSLARFFEGERRPGHFRGVATIVLKLFNLVAPERAYFGEKDAQQLAVVRRMVADLDVPVEIRACPTARDADGLALSSRNAYLAAAERAAAPNLFKALTILTQRLQAGEQDVIAAVSAARACLDSLREDYLGVVDPHAFEPLTTAPLGANLLAVGAAFAGTTRLIDNLKVQTPISKEAPR